MKLLEAEPNKTYTVREIDTEDEEMNGFLFRLGCYSGEPITLISKKKKNCIVAIKDGRYNLDNLLAQAIIVLPGKTSKRETRITGGCFPFFGGLS